MDTADLGCLEVAWRAAAPFIEVRNADQHERALALLNQLWETVGENNAHPLMGLLVTLATLVETYEEEHYPIPDVPGWEILNHYMEDHGLTESDLPEIGTPSVVSEILTGKRDLNASQIRTLAKRFKVPIAMFV